MAGARCLSGGARARLDKGARELFAARGGRCNAAMGTTLCTLNANGIRAAARRGLGQWLELRRPDVLCLQELRAWPGQVPGELRSPAGYNTRWECAEKGGYAGVGLYTRAPVERYSAGTGLRWSDAEGRFLRGDLEDLSVISLYLPSGSSGEERQARKFEFLEHFLPVARRLARERRPIALCGDLNIAHTELDIHDPRGNARNSGFLPEERAWFDRLLAAGWVDVFRGLHPGQGGLYSWWSARGRARELDRGWRLDYVLCNRRLAPRVRRAWIEKDADLSDHAPVWVEIEG